MFPFYTVNMKLFKKHPQNKAYLALDIGSEFVKAVIFNLKDSKINILGFGLHREDATSIESGIIKDLSELIDNCELAITQASLQAGIRPVEAVIGISGEQVKGFTTIIEFERAKPDQKISQKEMNNIAEKVQEVAYENSLEKFREEIGNSDLEIKLINGALTYIMIDGERVNDPVGFQGKKMQVGVFNAYAPLVQLSSLQKISLSLGLDVLAIAAEPYCLAEAVIPETELEFEAMILDLGGSTTDLIVIQHQDVVGTKVFTIGGQALTFEIATLFEIPYEEAEDLKYKYCRQEIEDKDQVIKIEKAVSSYLSLWKVGFETALSEFKDLPYLPRQIMLAGGGALLPQMKKILLEISKDKKYKFSKDPEITILTPQHLNNLSDQTQKLESPQEMTVLSLSAMMIDIIEGEKHFDIAFQK